LRCQKDIRRLTVISNKKELSVFEALIFGLAIILGLFIGIIFLIFSIIKAQLIWIGIFGLIFTFSIWLLVYVNKQNKQAEMY
jgi:hypothetical protein